MSLTVRLDKRHLLWAFLSLTVISLWTALIIEHAAPVLLPLLVLSVYFVFSYPPAVYYALAVAVPVSTELLLPGNLGTDFPSEQIMWVLFGLGIVFMLGGLDRLDLSAFYHPVSFLLLMTYAWIWIAAVFAVEPLVAVKYALAKSWYLAVFFFIALYFFRDRRRVDRWFKLLIATVTLTVLIVLARHSASGFSFDMINKVLDPFYRNHVVYACMTGAAVPWAWYFMRKAQRRGEGMLNIWAAILVLMILATFLSYTRAAIIALGFMAIWPLVIRLKATRWAVLAGLVGAVVVMAFFIREKRYLEYAPDYYKTITHKRFDRLLEATYQLEDISTMERVYRWVAGYHMMRDNPWTGVGPSNFYPTYQSYTVTSFRTYVSDNPERSGIHNYYFMLIVEQGWPGLILFLIFSIYVLQLAQRLYHATIVREERSLYLAAAMCMIFVLVISLMNDMLETDKVGSVFFISSALIVAAAIRKRIR